MYVLVWDGEWGGAWGVDRGWPPLPTRPQQYCDPASLVLNHSTSMKSGTASVDMTIIIDSSGIKAENNCKVNTCLAN